MTIRPELKTQIRDHLLKSRAHLETSYKKVQAIKIQSNQPEEELETLESFSSRFARFSDLAVSKYFRMLALEQDPAYRGTPIDLLNLAEKMGWIDSAKDWKRIRELRNVAAHEYVANDAVALYGELVRLTPILLSLKISP